MQNGGGKKHRRQQVWNATEDCKPMNQDDLIIRYAYPNLEVDHRPYTITRNPTNPGPQTTRRKLGHNSRVTCPTLVIHGTDDEVIDFSHGVSVYERCPAAVEPLWFTGAVHNDVELHAEYGSSITRKDPYHGPGQLDITRRKLRHNDSSHSRLVVYSTGQLVYYLGSTEKLSAVLAQKSTENHNRTGEEVHPFTLWNAGRCRSRANCQSSCLRRLLHPCGRDALLPSYCSGGSTLLCNGMTGIGATGLVFIAFFALVDSSVYIRYEGLVMDIKGYKTEKGATSIQQCAEICDKDQNCKAIHFVKSLTNCCMYDCIPMRKRLTTDTPADISDVHLKRPTKKGACETAPINTEFFIYTTFHAL